MKRPLPNLWVLSVLVMAGCATTRSVSSHAFAVPPESPKALSTLEQQLGYAGRLAVSQSYRADFDPVEIRRMTRVGNRLTHYSERPNVPYQYNILDTKRANAFSMPDGTIYLTRVMLALMPEDGQIAAILAHELAHITHQHAVEAYRRWTSPGRVLGSILAGTATSAVLGSPALGVWLVQQVSERGYSQTQEYQADVMALRYLIRSGYSPYDYLEAMERVRVHVAQEPADEPRRSWFFSTHPGWEDRLALLRQALSKIEQEERVRYNPKDFSP